MEKILGYIIVIAIIFGAQIVWRIIIGAASAAGKAATGNGNFKDNLNASVFGMSEFQMRIVDEEIPSDSTTLKAKFVEIKGLYPVTYPKEAAFVISILDTTDSEESAPVLSILEDYQEPSTPAFQAVIPVGKIQPNYGFVSWTRIGGVLTDFLEAPYKGNRKLSIFLRMIDVDNPPNIQLGYHDRDEGLIWIGGYSFEYNMPYSGYREEQENRIKAHTTIIRLAVLVALSDNNLDDKEGKTIQAWMYKTLYGYSQTALEKTKEIFNNASKEAYHDAKNNKISLANLCEELNRIGNNGYKYDAIELCYDVVAADKKIESSEANAIKKIATLLNLDITEVEKIKDKKLIGLDSKAQGGASVEELLGITEDMSNDEVNTHLRKEFQKWNSRLNTLSEGEERANAQKMLDLIAEARNNRAA